MAAYYLTHDHNTNNNATQTPPQIQQNANLHTLLLMNNPNLASHYDQHQHQHQHQHPQSSDNNNDGSNNNNIMFNHQFVRPEYGNVTLYGYPQEEAREVSRARQGLSLTLASNNPGVGGGDGAGGGGQASVLGSKYLRVTQELLEEVVNVGDTLTSSNNNNNNNNIGVTSDDHSPKKGKGVCDTPSGGGGSGGGGVVQLSTSERQEIQMKKAKLVTMLDEAEQRYRQYSNQMQMVIESFERAAGIGSAKTYTALALKTISKQFRCLKDAIQGQIRAANKSLGEDDGVSGSSAGKIQGSRLKFIDHQIRQQRALQQLGMIQNHNAWRPQRGLPERSVSVLRAWLFEHFLHPYPKDSDKILLAKQTGLTRSQVSNWFINARVRLWKPMIEEMYNEELKEHEQNGSEDKSNSNDQDIIDRPSNTVEKSINNNGDQTQVVKANNNNAGNYPPYEHGFTLTGALDMEGISQGSPKRQRSNQLLNNGNEILIKFGDEKQELRDNGVGYPIISGGMNFMGGELGSYPMNDLGRFEAEDFPPPRYLHQGNGNGGISLSLGLPPSCENHHQQQQFNHLTTTSHHSFMAPNQSIISTWE